MFRYKNIADSKIKNIYQAGPEFIIFVFTSDWFSVSGSINLPPLPDYIPNESEKPLETILKLDDFFGDQKWREKLLRSTDTQTKIDLFVSDYKHKLQEWFRYVLALPF